MRVFIFLAIVILTVISVYEANAQNEGIRSDDYLYSQEFIKAKVIRVKPKERIVTVRGVVRGQTRELTITEGARITINGRDARLRNLRPGDEILLTVVIEDENPLVSRIKLPNTELDLESRQLNPPEPQSRKTSDPQTPDR